MIAAFSFIRPLFRQPLDHPVEYVKDIATGAIGSAALGAWIFDYIRGVEGCIAGALAIVLLLVRIRRNMQGKDVSNDRA